VNIEGENSTPGPGQYDVSSLKQKIAFTMGRRNEKNKFLSTTACFTTADNTFLRKSIGCKFSKANREEVKSEIIFNPGPGTYNTNFKRKITSENKGFGSANRSSIEPKDLSLLPGPGKYEIPSFVNKKTQCVSIKTQMKKFEKNKIHIPGPGTYNIENFRYTHKKSPSWVIGKKELERSSSETKFSTNTSLPGPGSYKPVEDAIKKSSSRWKINNTGRNVVSLSKYSTPGPGSYNIDENKRNGVKFSKSYRKGIMNSITNPGPGSYEAGNPSLKCNPSFTIRQKETKLARSIEKYKNDIPAPGFYTSAYNKKSNSIGFTRAKRNTNLSTSSNQTPGPGAYNIPSRVAEFPSYENRFLNKVVE